jgi:hypothetical protein
VNEDEQQFVKAGAEAAMKPFASLIERLFGGSVDEIGGMWQDSLKARRQIRAARLFAKVQAQIEAASFESQAVPDYIWIPLLNAATMQDDEMKRYRTNGLRYLPTPPIPGRKTR